MDNIGSLTFGGINQTDTIESEILLSYQLHIRPLTLKKQGINQSEFGACVSENSGDNNILRPLTPLKSQIRDWAGISDTVDVTGKGGTLSYRINPTHRNGRAKVHRSKGRGAYSRP